MSIDLDAAYRLYRRPLLKRAANLCRNTMNAEDLVQDAFVEAARNPGAVRNVLGWLHGVLHYVFIRSIRAPKPVVEFEDYVAPGQESAAELYFVDRAMSQLTEKQRNAILMSAVDGMSATEIGHALGISPQGGSDILRRARRQLTINQDSRKT
ncbi:RNA polymerase sigma factor [Sphingopyxis sp. GW247-27LB]|uniref:RNA polymerase sigma factor n=1 Tax=Sphingopyxis sp. GW247-27LB TaxID=2012632 RepID=UPI0015951552|nr:sigma-70 family RNA polymerase sigma factor [Sphingopyxis sp. GW247-27LB]